MPKPAAVLSAQPAKSQFQRINATFFMIGTFLFWASLYLYVPILPAYVQAKTDNLAFVGTILSMYGLWQAVVRLPLGIAVDWLGHRKLFMLGGLSLAALGALLMLTANSAAALLIGRSVTGLAAATWAIFVVAFSGYYSERETIRATALLSFVNSVGRIIATGATGTLTHWGGQPLPFYLAIGTAGLGAVFMALTKQEQQAPSPHVPVSLKSISGVIRRDDVLIPSILAALCQYVSWATTYSFTPILAEQLGADEIAQSALLTGHLSAIILGNLSAAFVTRRVGIRRLTMLGSIMLALGVGLTAFSTSLPFLVGVQCLMGLVIGMQLPTLMGLSIRSVNQSERNTAMGLHQSIYAIGMFGGPWLSGIIANLLGLRGMLAATALTTLGIAIPIIMLWGRVFEHGSSSTDQEVSI